MWNSKITCCSKQLSLGSQHTCLASYIALNKWHIFGHNCNPQQKSHLVGFSFEGRECLVIVHVEDVDRDVEIDTKHERHNWRGKHPVVSQHSSQVTKLQNEATFTDTDLFLSPEIDCSVQSWSSGVIYDDTS